MIINTQPEFNFQEFQAVNMARSIGPFQCGDKSNLYWVSALVEELGELAGATKKLDRGFNARELKKMQDKWQKNNVGMELPSRGESEAEWRGEKMQAQASEAADIFIYLDLFCQRNGINLFEAVKEKFNKVSEEMECKEFKI